MNLFYILLFLSGLMMAQKTTHFPNDQHSYLGGKEGFYKDFQKVLNSKKLKPCENKKEIFLAFIVVNENQTGELYKADQLPDLKNKCSEELTKEVLKDLDGWIPAKINGQTTTAIASYLIFPDAFFENYKEGYTPENTLVQPVFPGGTQAFRKEVKKRVDIDDFYVKGKGKVTVNVLFVVNLEGNIENITLENSSGLKQYDDMIIAAIQSIKKKWTPGKIHDFPIKNRFRLPLSLRDD